MGSRDKRQPRVTRTTPVPPASQGLLSTEGSDAPVGFGCSEVHQKTNLARLDKTETIVSLVSPLTQVAVERASKMGLPIPKDRSDFPDFQDKFKLFSK